MSWNRSVMAWRGLAAVCLGFIVIAAIIMSAEARSAEIAREWRGTYNYPDDTPPVSFTMEISASGGSFSGRTTEPATFGDGTSSNLYANISGSISGNSIRFTKTYDGTGGVSHSVDYQGSLSAGGTTMSGTWRVGTFSGSFTAAALSQPRQTSCITPSDQFRTTDNFLYWNFLNSCDKDVFVSVCAERGNNVNNILGVTVPAHQSADINLGMSTPSDIKLSWKEGGGIRCPGGQ